MVEPAMTVAASLTSWLTLASAIIAAAMSYKAMKSFSFGEMRMLAKIIFMTVVVLVVASFFLAYYHTFAAGWGRDIWHIGAILSLVVSIYTGYRFISLNKRLRMR